MGRQYGEPGSVTQTFWVIPFNNRPLLAWGDGIYWWKHMTGGFLLVQLDEQPDILWLARAVTINGLAMIQYVPIEPIEALDGTPVPALPIVPFDRVEVAQKQAEETRQRQMRERP